MPQASLEEDSTHKLVERMEAMEAKLMERFEAMEANSRVTRPRSAFDIQFAPSQELDAPPEGEWGRRGAKNGETLV